jgi:TPR repeat protein
MIDVQHLRSSRFRVVALLVSAVLFAAPVQAGSDSFGVAKAAFDSASGSKDVLHEGYVKAFTIWRDLAAAGDARALYHLGIMQMFGLGGAKFSREGGMRNIHLAAENDYAVAQSYLGLLAEHGDGSFARLGPDVALQWWRKGAEGNHCPAIRRMAKAYTNGELGLTADAARAAEWKAREPGCVKN